MARFPKSGILDRGENANGFRSVGGAGYANRDPTQPGKKSNEGMCPSIWPGRSVNGDRWKQWSPGETDDQGGEHDW
jgi:hypothetical protein